MPLFVLFTRIATDTIQPMIETYSQYIRNYIREQSSSRQKQKCPGEHHFVATYLLPKLFEMTKRIPDYVNPDGLKKVLGDLVYHDGDKHRFGIEVKLGVVVLTNYEYNKWIVQTSAAEWPDVFIGVSADGIALSSWASFREAYIEAIKKNDQKLKRKETGNGPTKRLHLLKDSFIRNGEWHAFSTNEAEDASREVQFLNRLRTYVKKIKRG